MARTVVVIRHSSTGEVIGAFCDRDCAEARYGDFGDTKFDRVRLATHGRGILAYAARVLSCDECGDNLADQVEENS